MSRFFKFLGIGTAIGTIAYGIIKYKHDEQFKEKVDGVIEKAEEKASKVMDKTLDFSAKHPVLTTVAFAAVIFTPIIAIRRAMAPTIEHYQNVVQSVTDDYNYGVDPDDPVNDSYEYDKRARGNDELRYQLEQILTEPDNYLIVPKTDYEKYQKAYETAADGWKEEYREKWDKVNEFAKTLDLVEGESFWIDEPSQYDVDGDEPIVSHMINGEGCYPPDRS